MMARSPPPVDLRVTQEVSNVSFAVGAGLQALALPERASCIVCPHLKLSDALWKNPFSSSFCIKFHQEESVMYRPWPLPTVVALLGQTALAKKFEAHPTILQNVQAGPIMICWGGL